MDFYSAKFGKALRNIRKDLSLTQNEVALLSQVNAETIRRIEAGKVIPRFETLESLSNVYKVDLNSLFLEYRVDDYSYFYEIKNRLEGKFNNDEFHTLDLEIKELKSIVNINNTFYKDFITQLILLSEAVILYKKMKSYNKALENLIQAIRITTPKFNLENYDSFVYSSIEIRVLMNIAFVLNKLNQKDGYKNILEFCVVNLNFDDELYPKLCHNLAGVYRRNKNFKKALEYSNIGIKSSKENRNINTLHGLYYGKGIVEYKLDKPEYKKSLNIAFTLCEAFGQDELRKTIIDNCRNVFGIEI